MGPIAAFFATYFFKILSVIADVLVVAFIGYCVWLQFNPKPTSTTNQNAQQIYNYVLYPDKTTFVLGKFGGFEFLSWHSYPALSSIKQKVLK